MTKRGDVQNVVNRGKKLVGSVASGVGSVASGVGKFVGSVVPKSFKRAISGGKSRKTRKARKSRKSRK
jgi:hypothetical protein